MTTYESHKATVEARRSVASSSTAVSRHENALQHYLNAEAHLSEPVNHDQVRPTTEPTIDGPASPGTAAAATIATHTPVYRSDLVVAGVDGSGSARDAARWAAGEAARRHGALRLIHAYCLAPAGYSGYNPYPATLLTQLREEGEELLTHTVAGLHGDYPTLDISTQLIHGDAATVLRRASDGAALAVVGVHGRNRIKLDPDSIAADLAANSPVPVAVIRDGEAPTDGPVVVGVDGSPASEAAIAFAFDAATLRGVSLVAVHAWTDPALDGPVPSNSAAIVDPQPIAQTKRILLAERVAGWVDKYPDVPVQQVLAHDRAAPALLRYTETAQLIVVGTRGRGRLASMLLGSTSHALINRAHCPVVVARPHSVG